MFSDIIRQILTTRLTGEAQTQALHGRRPRAQSPLGDKPLVASLSHSLAPQPAPRPNPVYTGSVYDLAANDNVAGLGFWAYEDDYDLVDEDWRAVTLSNKTRGVVFNDLNPAAEAVDWWFGSLKAANTHATRAACQVVPFRKHDTLSALA